MKLKYTLLFAVGLTAGGLHAATLTVVNTNDSLAGSLRQALQDASPGDKIVFNIPTGDPGYDPATRSWKISLTSAALQIAKDLTIDGAGSRIVVRWGGVRSTAIDGRIFDITAGTVRIANLTIADGFTANIAGGIRNAGTLTLSNCTLTNNETYQLGAALLNSGTGSVINCTFANNHMETSGNVITNTNGGSLTVRSCTIAFNPALGSGRPGFGIYNQSGTVHVGNSVIAKNGVGLSSSEGDVVGAFISDGYNFIGAIGSATGFGGSGAHDQLGTVAFPADPRLGPLQDNGGVTQTMLPLAGSLLIDQGNSFGLVTDQRDRLRPLDNPGIVNAGDSADIGAVETDVAQTGPTFTVNTTDEHSDVLCGLQDCSLWDAANAADEYDRNTGQPGTVKFASNVRGIITTALQADGIEIWHVNIIGPGASALTISGAGASRVFHIMPSANVQISNLKIANGSIFGDGGGLLNEGDLSLSNCIISANQTLGGGNGGGLANHGTVTLTNVTLSGNSGGGGGGIFNDGTCNATDVTLSANHAGQLGGAAYNYNPGRLTLTNSTLSGNSSDQGGGITNAGGNLVLTNVTLSGNSAFMVGGIDNADSPISITNTIIAKGTSGDNCNVLSSVLNGNSNLSDDNTCGFTTTGDPLQRDNVSDLKLGPLANNGGFTQTHLPQTGSRAIDHGTTVAGLNTDQRGVKRPQGPAFDVGAVEAGVTLIEDKSYFIQYDGWAGIKNASANGGTYRISKTTNDTVTYKFTNTAIKWITAKGPNMGQALVTIDGTSAGTIDLYSPSVLWKQQIAFSGLTNAAHTIVIKVTGTKNANATDFNVAVDGFLVGSSTTPVQESAVAVTYNNWTGTSQSAASGGSYRSNGTLGSVARFKFTGTAISFVTARGPSYGMANLLIDGLTKSSNLDLYATSPQWKYGVSYSGLTNATHTIEIRPTHTKNSSSTGYNVVLDAFTGPFTAVP